MPPTSTEKPVLTHDKQKQRYIPADAFFLKELDISNAAGEIRTDKYDKYRQIDKFIETVDTLYEASSLKSVSPLNVYDLGSGKSYLTFALYSYFAEMKKKQIEMTGVEVRKELVDMSEKLAETCSFTGLHFQQTDIAKAEIKKAHIVVALHACDTATDDAITKAIGANSQMVILAPCCHKYVRKHMNLTGALADLLREGIHIQRESDIVTDSLRALVLEYYGYKTQIFEFISSEHTSKNIMITAVKKSHEKNPEALEKIKNIKQLFGIPDFYLDKQLNLKV